MMVIIMSFITALWLGILTSVSPCPLATNIAAVSFLSKNIIHPKSVFINSVFYTLGRMLAYGVLGYIIVFSFVSIPVLANFLQKYMNRVFGPILIIVGLLLLDIVKLKIARFEISEKHQEKLAKSGIAGAFGLGFLFALVLCPVSAALFFGSLIPMSLKSEFGLCLPLIYGIGTGLPVLIFAVFVALGVKILSYTIIVLRRAEFIMSKFTGVIFILVGLYYTVIYVFK